MNISRTFSSSLTFLLCISVSFGVFAEGQGCTISDTSLSPIQKWKENIDTLNSALRSAASKSACQSGGSTGSSLTSYVTRVAPLNDTIGLMKEVTGLATTGADFYAEMDSFLDPAGPVMELKPHKDSIEAIERSILDTTQFVGSHCAQSIEITTHILVGKSGYNTQGRTMSEILIAEARQTKEVKRFFQILSQGIQTEEYIDEVPFMIATPGFSRDMYVYFSPKHIQECRDNDPRKKAFMEVLKSAFTVGWKYPQAIQVWKDAMALMLYRGSQLVGAGETDASKEAQMKSIVQARKGGVGNSDIMIDSQFFKEFGYRPNSKTMTEKVDTQQRKAFYESMGYEFLRKVVPSIVAQNGTDGTGYFTASQTVEEAQKIQHLQDIEEALYTQYGPRKEGVALNKEKDPQLSSELAKVLQESKKRQKDEKESAKNVCTLLGEQATNAPGIRCPFDNNQARV